MFAQGLRDEVVSAEHFLYLFECGGHLLLGVGGHQREAYKRVMRCDGGGDNGVDEDALLQKVAGDGECLVVVAYKQGYDGRRCRADLASHVAESVEGVVGDFPQVFLTLRLGNHDVDGLEGGYRRGGGDACREDIGA